MHIFNKSTSSSETTDAQHPLAGLAAQRDTDPAPLGKHQIFTDTHTPQLFLFSFLWLAVQKTRSVLFRTRVDHFAVGNQRNSPIFAKRTRSNLVDSCGDDEDAGLVLLPKIVIGDSVGGLRFPGDQSTCFHFSRLPHPPPHDVFSTERLVYCCLVFQ